MGYINGWTKESTIKHLKKEFKGKSTRELNASQCMYRGDYGRKCVAGCFIPDALYKTEFETLETGIRYIMKNNPEIANSMPLDADSMVYWQTRHDMLHNKDSVEHHLNALIEQLDIIEKDFV